MGITTLLTILIIVLSSFVWVCIELLFSRISRIEKQMKEIENRLDRIKLELTGVTTIQPYRESLSVRGDGRHTYMVGPENKNRAAPRIRWWFSPATAQVSDFSY